MGRRADHCAKSLLEPQTLCPELKKGGTGGGGGVFTSCCTCATSEAKGTVSMCFLSLLAVQFSTNHYQKPCILMTLKLISSTAAPVLLTRH